MTSEHWTDEQLIEHLYGLRSADEHFAACPLCAARAEQVSRARREATHPPEIPDALLAAQRRSIYNRLGSPLRVWHPMRWAVSLAAMLAVALGLMLYRGNEAAHSRDDQFYAEISSLDQNPAPRAVQPIEALVAEDIQE